MKKNKFDLLSGFFLLGTGTIIAQVINLIAQPILTRIVSVEILGQYSLILSISSLIIPVASLKLDLLIITVKNDEEVEALMDTCIVIITVISLLFYLVIFVLLGVGNNQISTLGLFAFFIPLIVCFHSLKNLFLSHNNRYKQYKLISKNYISKELSMIVVQLATSIIGFGLSGLALGYLLSPLTGLKRQAELYISKHKNKKFISLKDIILFIYKYIDHIRYLVPSQFINTFSYTLIALTIGLLYSNADLGYYSVSIRVLGVPLVLISNNISRIYMQKLSELVNDGKNFSKFFYMFLLLLTIISVIGFSILFFIAPSLSIFIFGSEYVVAGEFISILCLLFAFRFVATSLIGTFVVFGKQKVEIYFQILLVLSGISIGYLAYFNQLSIQNYLKYLSVSYGFIYLLLLISLVVICMREKSCITSRI